MQFQPVDHPSERFNNLGAVAVLQAPDWATPVMKQYNAVQPRPEVPAAPRRCYFLLPLYFNICIPYISTFDFPITK
jgi:hypothetical protein